VHKPGIVHKELEEAPVWLGYHRDVEGIPKSTIDPLFKENWELCPILYARTQPARGKLKLEDTC
jgi:hypothetical protein